MSCHIQPGGRENRLVTRDNQLGNRAFISIACEASNFKYPKKASKTDEIDTKAATMPDHFQPRFSRTGLWYGLIAGGFWGWLSGGGIWAVFGVIVCYFEPLLSGAYAFMALTGAALGMLLGTICGAASGAIGGATVNPRVGVVAGIVGGILFRALTIHEVSWLAMAISSVLLGAPAALGGYKGGRVGQQLSGE